MDHHLPTLERTEQEKPGRLRRVAPHLWATDDEPLGGPANTCGFLLQRHDGNVFIYSTNNPGSYVDHIDELGGLSLILLNHRDEATQHVTELADHYRIHVRAHILEVEACQAKGVRSIAAISGDTVLGPDLDAIHTPGHTPGTTAYRWHNPEDGTRYLFTGDTFTNFTIDNFPAVVRFHRYGRNLADMRDTLDRIDETPSDVIVPGLANGTIHAYTWTDPQRQQLIDHARQQLASLDE